MDNEVKGQGEREVGRGGGGRREKANGEETTYP